MAPTTKHAASDDVALFYDALAPHYDEMTGFQRRFVHEKPFFRLLVEKYNMTTALDAGCGTGFHALLLTQLGVQVTGIDISREMLQRAEQHARELGLTVEFLQANFEEPLKRTFDAIMCLGNSLAHVLTADELRASLSNFAAILVQDGVLIVQLVNFERVLRSRERIQSVKEREGKIFVRFYDFEPEGVRFNILRLERGGNSFRHTLQSVLLRPIGRDELSQALIRSGFQQPNVYGAISLEDYTPDSSPDLVVIARKATSIPSS
jgi:SAM-dependent methyltransferase